MFMRLLYDLLKLAFQFFMWTASIWIYILFRDEVLEATPIEYRWALETLSPLVMVAYSYYYLKKYAQRWPFVLWSALMLFNGLRYFWEVYTYLILYVGNFDMFIKALASLPMLSTIPATIAVALGGKFIGFAFGKKLSLSLKLRGDSGEIDGASMSESGTHGTASMMSPAIRKKLLEDKHDGWILGQSNNGGLLRYSQPGHLLTICRTRGGKGVTAVTPNLLDYRGPSVVLDPKGENYFITASRRRRMGHTVAPIDPLGLVSPNGKGWGCNVFNFLDPSSASFVSDCMQLVSLMCNDGPKRGGGGENAFFDEKGKELLKTIVMWVADAPQEMMPWPRDLLTVRRIAAMPLNELQALLEKIYQTPGVANGIASRSAGSLKDLHERLFGSVVANANNSLFWLDSPTVAHAVCGSDFSLKDITAGNLDVYLCLPQEMLDSEPQLGRVLIGGFIMSLLRSRGAFEKQVLFMLDELPRLGYMPPIESALGIAGGMGATIWAFAQNWGQLVKAYGREGASVFSENAAVRQIFGVVGTDADDLSKMMGQTTVVSASSSLSAGRSSQTGAWRSSSSSNTNWQTGETGRALVTPDQIRTLPDDQQFLLLAGQSPLKARRAFYFSHPHFAGMYDKNPYFKGSQCVAA